MKRWIVAVVVLVLVVAGVIWRLRGDEHKPVAGPIAIATTSPTVPPGYRLVGRGRAVVEVPTGWATNRTRCGTAIADTVIFDSGGLVLLCAVIHPKSFSSVTISPYGTGSTVDPGPTVKVFSSKAEDALIVVRSDDKAVFDRIVKSSRLLPPGSTTVPDLFDGFAGGRPGAEATPTPAEITKRLERFGLKVRFARLNAVRGAANSYSTPAAGTVVRTGSTVVVALTVAS